MAFYRRLFVFLTLAAALLAVPAMSTARTTPLGRPSALAPFVAPTTASSTRHGVAVFIPIWMSMLTPDAQPYDADAPSNAAAGVSPAGTAAALSVAGEVAMMLF
jgi:hypothetical protein